MQGYINSEMIDYMVENSDSAPECYADLFTGKHKQLVPRVYCSIFCVIKRRAGKVQQAQVDDPVHAVMHKPWENAAGHHEIEL